MSYFHGSSYWKNSVITSATAFYWSDPVIVTSPILEAFFEHVHPVLFASECWHNQEDNRLGWHFLNFFNYLNIFRNVISFIVFHQLSFTATESYEYSLWLRLQELFVFTTALVEVRNVRVAEYGTCKCKVHESVFELAAERFIFFHLFECCVDPTTEVHIGTIALVLVEGFDIS